MQESKTSLHTVWWEQRTAWTSLAGAVTAAGALLALIYGDQKWAVGAGTLAAFLANLGSVFARAGGVEAATEVGQRVGVVPPSVEKDKAP